MSSFLCFICHSTVNSDTNEETREKYREVVGMNLCPDSHLCHICCHVLNKLWLFRCVCLKRSLEYPVLFSEKGTLNLQHNELEIHTVCPEDTCGQYHNRNINAKSYHFQSENYNECTNYETHHHYNQYNINQYVGLEDVRTDFDVYFNINEAVQKVFTTYDINDTRDITMYDINDTIPRDITTYDLNEIVPQDVITFDSKSVQTTVEGCFYQSKEVQTDIVTNLHIYSKDVPSHCDFNESSNQAPMRNDFIVDTGVNIEESNENIEEFNTDFNQNVNITDVIEEHDKSIEENTNTDHNGIIDEHDSMVEEIDINIQENDTTIEENDESEAIEEEITMKKKHKSKKGKKKDFEKIVLTLEQQKAELEAKRKEKKYIEAEFKCHSCALGFLFKDSYQTHMMRHEESNGEHRCVTCKLRFANPADLRAHRTVHSERYACARCGASVGLRGRSTHARQCGRQRGEAVACHLCGATFQDANGLQQHMKRFHKSKTSTRSYSCSVCAKTYTNQAAVRTHMIKHINRKFSCDRCPAVFSNPYRLNAHKKQHDAPQTDLFHCELCNVTYTSRKSLLAHRRNALNHQQTVYECPICARACPNQRALASHIQTVHAAAKLHACVLCPARYSSRKALVRHAGQHAGAAGAREAVCHLCGGKFKIVEVWASTPKTARAATLRSFLSQRGAAGYTTQRDPCKVGEYFIELRVYNCREVEHTPADERWKHALVTLKVATDDKTPVWRAVSGLLQAGKAEFKNVQPIRFPAGLK